MAETYADALIALDPDVIVEGMLLKGEVTTAESEAEFLGGGHAAQSPWQGGDDLLDCATTGPKHLYRQASPNVTPPGPGCC